tara:strand:+ start:2019 stop:2273 length:255 start_codon:yes stop_codon:yes gene_type:complete
MKKIQKEKCKMNTEKVRFKFQRVWSKSSGIRHRMVYKGVYKGDRYYYIRKVTQNLMIRKLRVNYVGNDLWVVDEDVQRRVINNN